MAQPRLFCLMEPKSGKIDQEGLISLGGDADTLACFVGGIAEAWYGHIPDELRKFALARIPEPLALIVNDFCTTHCTTARA